MEVELCYAALRCPSFYMHLWKARQKSLHFQGSLLVSPGQQFKTGLLMSGSGVFLRWSLALQGVPLAQMRKFIKTVYAYTLNYVP